MSTVSKIIAAVLLFAAFVLAFFAFKILVRPPEPPPVSSQRSQAPIATHPVVVAAKALGAGERLDSNSLKVEQWQVAPGQAYVSVAPLVGKILRMSVGAGQPITDADIAKGIATYLKPGQRAVAIAVDEIIGATNRVSPGDMVDVFFTLQQGNEVGVSQSRLLQSRVRVLAYGVQSVDGPESGATARGNNPQQVVSRTALLAVPVDQVNELLLASRAGRLQLALRAPDDNAVANANLFDSRAQVLVPKANLTPDQKNEVKDDVNLAYAGDSLVQLSGPQPPKDAPAKALAASPTVKSGGGPSVEVIRGDQAERLHY
jgi:pilus assembly protein CpaB